MQYQLYFIIKKICLIEFYNSYNILFLCEITGGDKRTSYETTAVDFFWFENLPPLSINCSNKKHFNEIIEHIKDPNRSAYFD